MEPAEEKRQEQLLPADHEENLSCDLLRNTVLKLLSFFLVHSERKRLRKPSKRLLEYAEEYDHLFAPKKKSKKVQEQLQKVG